MKARIFPVLAAAMIGVGAMTVSTSANAGSATAVKQVEFQQVCKDQGARFEQAWRYNDQGTQWGAVISCSNSVGMITCEGDSCAARRNTTGAASKTVAEFPAEPGIFASVLAYLMAK